MPKIKPLKTNPGKYDEWQIKPLIYQLELQTINGLLAESGNGVDSGCFTSPLSIKLGLDPSPEMNSTEKGYKIH